MIVIPDKVSFTPVCCRSSFQAVRQQGAHSGHRGFPIPAAQPNPEFLKLNAPNRPFATSPIRPEAEVHLHLIADRQRAAFHGNPSDGQRKHRGNNSSKSLSKKRGPESPLNTPNIEIKFLLSAVSLAINDCWHQMNPTPSGRGYIALYRL